jgi:hypothetical protein
LSGNHRYPAARRFAASVPAPGDIDLLESVQRGPMSRSYGQGTQVIDPGRPDESEHALHQFHRRVVQVLGDDADESAVVD